MLYVAERYLCRTLSSKEVQLFAYLYKDLGFPAELIEYLVEYCVGSGHSAFRYMETVALNWHSDGIKTAEEAREAHQEYGTESRRVMQAFGITGRMLSIKEKQYVKRWRKELNLPLDVIVEAVSVTMSATHQQSFEYADAILADWSSRGVQSVEQAKQAQAVRRQVRKRQAAPEKKTRTPQAANFDQRRGEYGTLLKNGNW